MTIVRRLLKIQGKKVDLMFGTLEKIAHLFNSHVYELSNGIKEEYIAIATKFIKEYEELVGKEEEGYGKIQENEQN